MVMSASDDPADKASYDAIMAHPPASVPTSEQGTAEAPESALTLSAVEKDVARQAGITEAEFKAQKAADLGIELPKASA